MPDTYDVPHAVTDTLALNRMGNLLPPWNIIPNDYPDRSRWREFQHTWFFNGLPADIEITARDGIDPKTAFEHLETIQGSFSPKHEHKMDAVAWLASKWLLKVRSPSTGKEWP